MKPRILFAALLAGLIAGVFCFVGSWLPFRPAALSERTWGNFWGLVGMLVGILAARRWTGGSQNPSGRLRTP